MKPSLNNWWVGQRWCSAYSVMASHLMQKQEKWPNRMREQRYLLSLANGLLFPSQHNTILVVIKHKVESESTERGLVRFILNSSHFSFAADQIQCILRLVNYYKSWKPKQQLSFSSSCFHCIRQLDSRGGCELLWTFLLRDKF